MKMRPQARAVGSTAGRESGLARHLRAFSQPNPTGAI